MFRAEFLAVFVIYLHTNYCMSSSIRPLVVYILQKGNTLTTGTYFRTYITTK